MTESIDIERVVKDVIGKYLSSSAKLAVGVSGGEDSMCLLAALLKIRDKKTLKVVHIQHGIRGAESIDDALFVERFCKKNGVEFLRFDADIPKIAAGEKSGVESAARNYRKKVFESLIRKRSADFIALAHHREDQTESVLMHVFRGSGTGGLAGMTEKDGFILRPLISVSKSGISKYVHENAVPFRVDSTNCDTSYNRNFLRKEVIPLIQRRYDVQAAAERLAFLSAADDRFIYSLIGDDEFFENGNECSFASSALDKPYALSSRYAITAMKKAGLCGDFEKKHIDAVLSLSGMQNGCETALPHGYRAVKEYDLVTVYKKNVPQFDETAFALGITPFAEGYVTVAAADKSFEKGSPVFDGDKIPSSAVIRFRRDGDIFKPFGGGTKKLKEYFIDEKVPRRYRDGIPLICDGNNVLCVCGMEISDYIKVTDNTGICLKFTYDKE